VKRLKASEAVSGNPGSPPILNEILAFL